MQKYNCQTSVENVVLMSAKTDSSNIVPAINWKANRLYNIFAMEVAFSGLYFVFRVPLLISSLF